MNVYPITEFILNVGLCITVIVIVVALICLSIESINDVIIARKRSNNEDKIKDIIKKIGGR